MRCGGGVNHRLGLGDAVLIKDNHVAAAGSVGAALDAARRHAPDLPCEVEVDTLDQLDEVLALGAELVLLDNFTVADTAEAVRRRGEPPRPAWSPPAACSWRTPAPTPRPASTSSPSARSPTPSRRWTWDWTCADRQAHARGMTGERPVVEWVRPWGPLAVAGGTAALVLAALGTWVLVGALPGLVADVLFVLALSVLLRHRTAFTDPEDCTSAGMSVLGFAWATAVACGLVVSVQRSTWAWGAPVSWWVHVLVGLGIVALTGAVSWACVLAVLPRERGRRVPRGELGGAGGRGRRPLDALARRHRDLGRDGVRRRGRAARRAARSPHSCACGSCPSPTELGALTAGLP